MITIRPVKKEDILAISKIHKEIFKDHYLGNFSIRILSQFYKSFISVDTIFLVSVDFTNLTINGFVLGGSSDQLFEARKNFINDSIFRFLFEIMIKPNIWIDSLTRLCHKNQRNKSNIAFRLLSIGIDPSSQGHGVAMKLVEAFDEIAYDLKVNEYGLSVHSTNLRAINFYTKMGFQIESKKPNSIFFYKKVKSSNEL